MQPFTYTVASTVQDASRKSANSNQTLLGGGTCLIDLMKLDVMLPDHLVDVRKVSEGAVEDKGSSVLISGTATNSGVAYNELIQKQFPVLSQALLSGASPQLRNAATIAGNIMQRTRCYYYRDTATRCNEREPGSGCDAIEGFNRIHAVLGVSDHCIATHPSDMCVALAALDAVVHIQNGTTRKEVAFTDFHVLPGEHPEIETILQTGDVITGVEIAKSNLARNSHYLKVRDRASFSFALTSAAVALDGASTIGGARLALGGVGTKPWRAAEAEAALLGKPANAESFREAAEIAMRTAVPHKHNKFKIELAKRTIVKAYEELAKG